MNQHPITRRPWGHPAVLALAGLLSLAAVPAPPAGAAEGPAPPRGARMAEEPPRVELPSGELVLPMSTYGSRPLVELEINGTGPHRFILDSGAPGTVVDAGLVEELELPRIGIQRLSSPAGEGMDVPRVVMEDVRLGGMVVRDLKAASMDLAGLFGDPEGPRGVLSAHLFTGALLTFDYPGGRILVRPGELPEADGKRVFQYDEPGGHPTVPLTVAGTVIPAHLDTGSHGSISLPGRYMGSLPLKSEPVERGRARLVDTEIVLHAAPLDGTVLLGEYALEDPEIIFGDQLPAGNIGYGVLRQFEVTLDFKNLRVRLDRPEGAGPLAAPPPAARRMIRQGPGAPAEAGFDAGAGKPKRYGLGIEKRGQDILVVRLVEAGSVAESAGLQAGDRILEINGTPAGGLGPDDQRRLFTSSPLSLVIERDGSTRTVRMSLPE